MSQLHRRKWVAARRRYSRYFGHLFSLDDWQTWCLRESCTFFSHLFALKVDFAYHSFNLLTHWIKFVTGRHENIQWLFFFKWRQLVFPWVVFSSLPPRSLAIQEAIPLFPLLYHFKKEHFCRQLRILCREIKCNEKWRSGTPIFKFCKHFLKLITKKAKDP